MVYYEDIEELEVSTRMRRMTQIYTDFCTQILMDYGDLRRIKSPLPPFKKGGVVAEGEYYDIKSFFET